MNPPHSQKNILIVGAGSVGQVYGNHLQQAGAKVCFFVKEKYAHSCKQGFNLYPLNGKDKKSPVRFTPDRVYWELRELDQEQWDQVYLCIPSTGLRGAWFKPFSQAIGNATLVSVLPGIEDSEYILNTIPKKQLVSGTISFASYHAPLADEVRGPSGMAYWFFPMSPSQFSGGDDQRVENVVRLLNQGRFPAKRVKDIRPFLIFSIASTQALIRAFEIGGWTLNGLMEKRLLEQACTASVESISVAAKTLGVSPPWFKVLYHPALIKLVLSIAPYLTPFPLEAMLRTHYQKVKAQTHFEMNTYIEVGLKSGVAVETLKQLSRP